jgi:prepilin-type N-terminal cleavage/methylation domain-containing protein
MTKATGSRGSAGSTAGFTLVELLMVIVIIALLVGLLVPAIGAAVRKSREAACQAEFSQLSQALASFASAHGSYPPSRILLCEDGNYGPYMQVQASTFATPNAVDVSTGQLAARSVQALRKFWPRMQLSTNPNGGAVYTQASGAWLDFNGNGVLDPAYVAQGDECLVLFLGGQPTAVASASGTQLVANGFCRSPLNPFMPASSPLAANRSTPMHAFAPDRLADVDGDGLPSYHDSLGTKRPIAYFSAYGGGGYDPNDVNYDSGSALAEPDESGTTAATGLKFAVPYPVVTTGTPNVCSSPAPNPYTSGPTVGSAATSWLNGQTYQLISAGYDGEYGIGGQYAASSDAPLPIDPADTVPTVSTTAAPPDPNLGLRRRESDNLTNFKGGRLD